MKLKDLIERLHNYSFTFGDCDVSADSTLTLTKVKGTTALTIDALVDHAEISFGSLSDPSATYSTASELTSASPRASVVSPYGG